MIRLAAPETNIPEVVRNAERCVLGSMLRDNECIADVLNVVRKDYFTAADNQDIFAVIVNLWDAAKPADLVTVAESLQRTDLWHRHHGPYLMELWDSSPTAANALHYARIVRERAVLRSLASAGARISHIADKPSGDAESTLEEAEKLIFAIGELGVEGQTHELRELVFGALNQFDAAASGRGTTGLPTGFRDLDELTTGLHPGELVILGARPSVGKTAMGLAVANNARKHGAVVFFASLEQSRQELAMRLLCMEARVNSHRVRSGRVSVDDEVRLSDAVPGLREGSMHIDDAARQGMLRIAANARRIKRKHGLGLLVVDYVQLIEPESRRDPRYEQVGQCTRKLKALAKELSVPVLALAQLNRASEERPNARPRLSDLRESGNVEQDADTVLLLHRNEEQSPGVIEVIVGKQRNGPTGEVTLAFRKESMRFEDYQPGTPYDSFAN